MVPGRIYGYVTSRSTILLLSKDTVDIFFSYYSIFSLKSPVLPNRVLVVVT